jgi:hypothetical protein
MQRCRVALDKTPMVGRLFGFEPETRKFLTLVFLVIFTRIIIDLEFRVRVFLRRFRGRQQILLGLQVVVVIELDLSGAKAAL